MDFIRVMFDCPWVQADTFLILQGLLVLAGKFAVEKFEIMFVNLMEYVSPTVHQVLGGLIVLLYVMSYGTAIAIWAYSNDQLLKLFRGNNNDSQAIISPSFGPLHDSLWRCHEHLGLI